MRSPLLRIENLNITANKTDIKIINQISFELSNNRCLGILGESGSGKTMICRALMGLLDQHFTVQGSIFFKDQDLLAASAKQLRQFRGRQCCMVMQNPMSAFDPISCIGKQMIQTFRIHKKINYAQAVDLSVYVLECMQLKDPKQILKKYPHQLSGGMLQRVMIAIAIAMQPELIIADEPTTALDAVTQYEVMEQFTRIRQEFGTAMIFISHDFGVISKIADDVLVINQGKIVERGTKDDIFCRPKQEYTRYLISTRTRLMRKYHEAIGTGQFKPYQQVVR